MGHFQSILISGVTLGPFLVLRSLLVNFVFGGHFGSIVGSGALLVQFGFLIHFGSIFGLGVT